MFFSLADVDAVLRPLQQVLRRPRRAGQLRVRLGGGEEAHHDAIHQVRSVQKTFLCVKAGMRKKALPNFANLKMTYEFEEMTLTGNT